MGTHHLLSLALTPFLFYAGRNCRSSSGEWQRFGFRGRVGSSLQQPPNNGMQSDVEGPGSNFCCTVWH